jgi:hypothetical protein
VSEKRADIHVEKLRVGEDLHSDHERFFCLEQQWWKRGAVMSAGAVRVVYVISDFGQENVDERWSD